MKIEYEVKKSARARRIRLTVKPGGSILLTVPRGATLQAAQAFVTQKNEWLRRAVSKMKTIAPRIVLSRRVSRADREAARQFILKRIAVLNQVYNFVYRSVTIRNQKTRWGSCSRKGDLNFNYRVMLLPQELADYVIVHELCHLREFNHSDRFWELIAQVIPNPRLLRKALRSYDLRLS